MYVYVYTYIRIIGIFVCAHIYMCIYIYVLMEPTGFRMLRVSTLWDAGFWF